MNFSNEQLGILDDHFNRSNELSPELAEIALAVKAAYATPKAPEVQIVETAIDTPKEQGDSSAISSDAEVVAPEPVSEAVIADAPAQTDAPAE